MPHGVLWLDADPSMLIDCPACAASYHVSRSEIGAEGRAVICPRCDTQWLVGGDDLAPAENDIQVSAFSARPERPLPEEPEPRAAFPWRTFVAPVTAIGLLALSMATIGLRERIVRTAPRVAALYEAIGLPVNVRGLALAEVKPVRSEANPVDMTVTGEIRNIRPRRTAVPRLTYEVRDAGGAVIASWTERVGVQALPPGGTLPFVSSPHAVPPEGQSILVRFASEEAAPPTVRLARRQDRAVD